LADPERLRYWVAELGGSGSVVGQAAISREWSDWRDGWIWWLQSVYVAQPYRGCGVFRAIYQHIEQEARGNPEVIGLRLYVKTTISPRATYLSVAGNEARRLLGFRSALARTLRQTRDPSV